LRIDTSPTIDTLYAAEDGVSQALARFANDPLSQLATIRQMRIELVRAELAAVKLARSLDDNARGRERPRHSWTEISHALGLGRQAAWRRWVDVLR
jgi:hypothetical protein